MSTRNYLDHYIDHLRKRTTRNDAMGAIVKALVKYGKDYIKRRKALSGKGTPMNHLRSIMLVYAISLLGPNNMKKAKEAAKIALGFLKHLVTTNPFK